MEMRIIGNGVEVSPAVEEYVRKKLAKLERHWDFISQTEVELRQQRNWHIVEVTLTAQGRILRGEERASDFYASLDSIVDKLDRQLVRYKEQLIQRSRGAQTISQEMVEGVEEEEAEEEAVDLGESPAIARIKTYPTKPMSLEEAVLQMELLQHHFFIFAEAGSNQIQVLYRRKDGSLGLMVPGEEA